MTTKNSTILFEGTITDAWESYITDPPSEVITLSYPVEPYSVVGVEFDENDDEIYETKKTIIYEGCCGITLPVFNGLKPGDKIRIIKL